MNDQPLSRRDALRRAAALATAAALPGPLLGCEERDAANVDGGWVPEAREMPAATEDEARLFTWIETLRAEPTRDRTAAFGLAAARVGELAIGTPYEGFTLEEYLRAGGSPTRTEPLTLHLTRFDCVSLVESCIAIARIARGGEAPTWEAFAQEMERMRYRGGVRGTYATRLHYFSEWLNDNEQRGLVDILSDDLGGIPDERPLRFMSSNPDSYPALSHPGVREEIAEVEHSLDGQPRWVIPTERIPEVDSRIQTGDILAFATSIPGLDVTHAAFAYRDERDILRVLHAPLSGGVVEITDSTLLEYVRAIRQSTGILLARPLDG